MKLRQLAPKMLGLALVTLGAAIILAYYYGAAGGTMPFNKDTYEIKAYVKEPQGLQKHADVRASGVKVGSVQEIVPAPPRLQTQDQTVAIVTMRLKKVITPIYKDASTLVRQKTLVGENYIDLDRGTPQAGMLPAKSTLPLKSAQQAVPLDRILNSFDLKTRDHIARFVTSLGKGFNGRGTDINQLISGLNPLFDDGKHVTDVLNAQHEQVANVVGQSGTVFNALGARRQDMISLIHSAKITAQAVAARDQQLRQTFADFPATLNQANQTVNKLSSFSTRATPVLHNLRTGLTNLRPALVDLKPTATQTRVLFDRLGPLLKVTNPLLSRLRSFSKTAAPGFPALNAFLRQANPGLDYFKPYAKDTVGFLQNFGTNVFYDHDGGFGICACPANDQSFSSWTPAERKAAGILLDQGAISDYIHMDSNHARKPNQLPQANIPFRGKYPQIQAEPTP